MIRPMTSDDLPALGRLIDATGLFPSEMLDEMTAAYLAGNETGGLWFTDDDGGLVGVVYLAPERMTVGTWNMLLIAVHPDRQGQGRGTNLVKHVEQTFADRGERILLVETSGLPEFENTRRFYRARGYGEEARIREFYAADEDKVIFRKALGTG